MSRLVHCNNEPYDVYIGRPSIWGNPFTHISDKETLAEHVVSNRAEALEKYREYITNNQELMSKILELDNKVLGCFCITDGSFPIPYVCHGQILIELLNKAKFKILMKK